ncbi:MAG: hypothetical protein ABI692_07965 [Terracoccus sp.]
MSGAGGTEGALPSRRLEGATGETSAAQDEAKWRTEIALLLGSRCFPARLADLAAHLAQVQAPSRLLWRLSGVNPDIRFTSLDALIADIDSHAKAAPLHYREPM